MSLTVTGTVVDENGTGLGGLLVEARGDWLLTSEVVDSTTTPQHRRLHPGPVRDGRRTDPRVDVPGPGRRRPGAPGR
ncbi:MAG: hypothetical protein ACHP7G_10780 [Actinomycetales bacterium]